MRKIVCILTMVLFASTAYSQQVVTINGPSSVTKGATATYSVSGIPRGGSTIWNVQNGTLPDGSSHMVIRGASISVRVTWDNDCSGDGAISFVRFDTWPPSSSPTHTNTKAVRITSCGSSGGCSTPATVQATMDAIWRGSLSPVAKCNSIRSAYNYLTSGSNCSYDYSQVNTYGCL